MSSRLRLFFVLVSGLMLLNGASFANGGQLHVVAIHGILADVARNVAGDHAEVITLVPVGADQHGFVPTPSDLTTVAEADLVLINGAGWEETLLEAVESAGEGGNIVNASACAPIRPFDSGMGHDDHDDDHADDDHDDEHADDHADDDEHADDHADDDDHDDEHADDHADDDHDDEHTDEHADDDHDDEHTDEHADDDHDDEHADDHDDEHDDDDHAHDEDEMTSDIDCDSHDAEYAAIVGAANDSRAHIETMGRGKDIECLGGHGHDDDHGHGHGHGEGSCDPHLWMDPYNVIYWALMIRDSLSALDHDNEDVYGANAAAYAADLAALESDFIRPALADLPEEKRVLVTGHESLGYFATTYNFEIVSAVVPSLSTVAEPSAQDMAAVVDVVRAEGVPAIFSDIHLSDVLVRAIADETGADVVGLHTDSLGDADGPAGTYLDYMRYNVSVIAEALKGDWR